MRVLLSTYGSRDDVEPMVCLAVESVALGAEVRVRARSHVAVLLIRVSAALLIIGVWR